MKKGIIFFCISVLFLAGCAQHEIQQSELPEFPELPGENKTAISKLDNGIYKIGQIIVDKQARKFEITGKVLRLEQPLEFLAVAKEGERGYESFLELDADVYQFNLACIFIGLDKNKGKSPEFHFDSTPVEGDAVEIWISWETNGKSYRVEASDFFKNQERSLSSGEWVYTGSSFVSEEFGGGYMPALNGGTLVGFVHDPASIIEHRVGFGADSFSQVALAEEWPISVNAPVHVEFKYVGATLNR